MEDLKCAKRSQRLYLRRRLFMVEVSVCHSNHFYQYILVLCRLFPLYPRYRPLGDIQERHRMSALWGSNELVPYRLCSGVYVCKLQILGKTGTPFAVWNHTSYFIAFVDVSIGQMWRIRVRPWFLVDFGRKNCYFSLFWRYILPSITNYCDRRRSDLGDRVCCLEPYSVNVIGGRVTDVAVAGFVLGGGKANNFLNQCVLTASRLFVAHQPVRFGDWYRAMLWVGVPKCHCSDRYRSFRSRFILWLEGDLSW